MAHPQSITYVLHHPTGRLRAISNKDFREFTLAPAPIAHKQFRGMLLTQKFIVLQNLEETDIFLMGDLYDDKILPPDQAPVFDMQ